jgi:uncharacterized membrane protein YidH (DUF202 family)
MSFLSPVDTIKVLLPGLIALTSILVVVIAFLLERYTGTGYILDKETYRRLTWCMTFALIFGIVDTFLCLPILLGIEDILCKQVFLAYFTIVLILFCICLLLVGIGTYKTVKKTVRKKKND